MTRDALAKARAARWIERVRTHGELHGVTAVNVDALIRMLAAFPADAQIAVGDSDGDFAPLISLALRSRDDMFEARKFGTSQVLVLYPQE